jgi:hypothetical protein
MDGSLGDFRVVGRVTRLPATNETAESHTAIRQCMINSGRKPYVQVWCEAAHENAHKDTDNFLVTVGD